MRKFFLPLIFLLAITVQVQAQSSGIYESYAILSLNGGANAYYDMQAATANPDFQGANLGTFTSGTNTLVVKGGQNKTYKCGGCNITGSNTYFRVYPTGTPIGTFNSLAQSFLSNDAGGCGGNQTWEGTAGASNLISLLAPGNYTLEMYTDAPYDGCGTGTNLSNNGGANYTATFTVAVGTNPVFVSSLANPIPTSFLNLGAAFTAINGGAYTGTIAVGIYGNTAEGTATATLNASGTGSASYAAITISPQGGAAVTVSGATTAGAPLIDLNGADNVTINGLNTGGNSLTISNTTASATSGTSTIRFIGGATGNTITNCSVLGSTSVPLVTNGGNIFFSTDAVTVNGNDNNTISNCNIGPAGANLPSKLIYGNGSTTTSAIANSNITVTNCNLFDFFLTAGCAAFHILTGNTDWNITNNKIYQTATRTFTATGTMTGINFSNATFGNNIQITGNTIGYASSTATGTFTLAGAVPGAFQGIALATLPTAANACNINNNTISDISFTSSSGTFTAIITTTALGSSTININTNTIRNIASITTTGATYAINAGSATTTNIGSNTINNITRTGSGLTYVIGLQTGTNYAITGNTISNIALNSAASTSSIYGIYTPGSPVNISATGNTFTNLTTTSTGSATIKAIYDAISGAGNKTYSNNIINNLSAAGGATIVGIHASTASTPNPLDISGNVINTLSGGISVLGIQQTSTSTIANIYKNKIYDISGSNAATIVNGLVVSAGTTVNVYNNLIGDLRATAATVTSPASAVIGINLTSVTTTSNLNVYYNTVNINASSSGANFATTGIFHTASTTATTAALNLRNNVIVNTSTPAGTGLTVAFRRSSGIASTLNNFAATSNNNLFYAGIPGASNLIYSDGTSTAQTIAAYKAGVFTAGTIAPREAVSVSEAPAWQSIVGSSANFLKYNTSTATQIESGAANIATYTDDYVGTIRFGNAGTTSTGTAPDMGAWELNGVAADLTPPAITYTPLGFTCTTTGVSLTASITDASGVPTSGAGLPVLYWKKNAGAYTAATGTFVSGNNYSFTFGSGVVAGDVVSYYIAAQDNATVPNVATNPATGATGFTTSPPAASTAPTTPNTFSISTTLNGTYTVGAAGTYTTLAAAVNAYNTSCISGNVIFELIDANYPESNLTINANSYAIAAPYTLTIRPVAGNVATVTASNATGAIFNLNGAQYVTIDGRAGGVGTTNALTIENTSTAITLASTLQFINDAQNNSVKYCDVKGATNASGIGTILFSTTTGANGNDNNTIDRCNIFDASTGLPAQAIASSGTTTTVAQANDNITISNCNIYNFYSSTVAARGIFLSTGNNNWTITGNSFYQMAARSSGSTAVYNYINVSNATNIGGFTVTNNYFGGSGPLATTPSGTGSVTSTSTAELRGVILATSAAATTNSIQGNVFKNITFTSTSTTSVNNLIQINTGNANIGTITPNIIGDNTVNGSIAISLSGGQFQAMNLGTGAGTGIINAQNNVIAGITLTGVSSSSSFRAINAVTATGATLNISGNIIGSSTIANSNNVTTTTGTAIGISVAPSTASVNHVIANNTIMGMASTGGAVTGISCANTGTTSSVSINNNTINTLSSTGAVVVTGIAITSGVTSNIYKNKIYDLSGSNAATTVFGISLAAGTTNNVYNNLIGDLRAANANAADAIRGISITSSTTSSNQNVYYNTVFLNAASSGAIFGTTGIYHTTSSTATTSALDLRNNVIVNNSTPNTTGLTVAFRRSSGAASALNNFAATSNNNLFYAGTPGANNLIYSDGTSTAQTIAAYTGGVFTAGTISPRELASATELPTWQSSTGSSADYLKFSTTVATQIESGAANIATYTDDYLATIRFGNAGSTSTGTAPDMGAWELNGIPGDFTAPSITYTALGGTCTTTGVTLTAAIADIRSGVPTSGAGLPVLYWKANAGAYSAVTGTFVSGNNYSFTFASGVSAGDVISYYVAAQDNASPANVATSPSAGSASFTASPPAAGTAPTTPNTFTVQATLNGTYTVGVSGNYTTLTAAVAAYNNSCLAGPVVFNLTDATYPSETFPISINVNTYASAINTLTIKPSATSTISGSAASALIVLNGSDYITIDGSNAATTNGVCPLVASTRNLTLTNTNAGTSSSVIWLQTNGVDGTTNNIIRNCNIIGSANTQTLFGIGLGSSSISTSSLGSNNNNNRIENNNISAVQYGIYTQGASAAVKNTGNIINQNLINTPAPNNVGKGGIWTGFENNITISANNISEITQAASPDVFGISLGQGTLISATTFTGNEVSNATITNNIIGKVTNTGTFSANGISVTQATTGTTLIANNMIYGVASNGTSGDFAAGISLGGGAGSTTNVYNNTVLMQGTIAGSSAATQTSACLAVTNSTAPNLDIRNNIFANTQVGNTGATLRFAAVALAYSIYTTLISDNNDLYVAGAGPGTYTIGITGTVVGGTNSTTLAAWQSTTSKDAASKNVLPDFATTSDLHLVINANNAANLDGQGTAPLVATDIDCNTRSTPSDIGADEANYPVCSGTPTAGTASESISQVCANGSTVLSLTGAAATVGISYQWKSSTVNGGPYTDITGATSTTYTTGTLTATTYFVCVTTCANGGATATSNQLTFNVFPPASVSISPSSSNYCIGASAISLTASGASTYLWSPATGLSATTGAAVNASPATSTIYTVTGTDVNGCTSTATASISSYNPPSGVTANASASIICNGNTVNLTSTPQFLTKHFINCIRCWINGY